MSDLSTQETARRLSNRLAKEQRDHELSELQLIDERDAAEDAFMEAFTMVVGHPPEFSSAYGYKEALQDIEECLCPSLRAVK
ncbi:MAG: hypothetical protein ACR2QF_00960 [Geminicoccaceae bacterium]